MTGIEISSTSRSGVTRAASVTTEPPSATAATTSKSLESRCTRLSSIALWSSATSTRSRFTTRPSRSRGRRSRASSRHHSAANGKLNELGARAQPQLFHHAVLVEGHGSRRNVQDAPHFLHRSPFGEQLENLALAVRQLRRGPPADQRADDIAGDQRGDV